MADRSSCADYVRRLIQRKAQADHPGDTRAMLFNNHTFALVLIMVTPGSTNTLLALAGATVGVRSTFRLIWAAVMAYLGMILLLGALFRSLVDEFSAIRVAVQIVGCGYLVYMAVRMWEPRQMPAEVRVVTTRDVVVTTLLNPINLLIAFVLTPMGWASEMRVALPTLLSLAIIIPLAETAWVVAGATLGGAFRARSRILMPRGSALVLGGYAAILAGLRIAG